MIAPASPSSVGAAAEAEVSQSRQPLTADAVGAAVAARARELPWPITVVAETGSTNDDLADLARLGAGEQVLIADWQRTGKGRRGRVWTAPPGSGLTLSVLLRTPEISLGARSWIGAIGGLALIDAVASVAGLSAELKWPNDLLVGGVKCAGLLAESTADGVIIGMGLNVSLRTEELPRPDATSLLLAGASNLDRAALAAATLVALDGWVRRWRPSDAESSGLLAAYRAACATVGRQVRVLLPSGEHVTGTAVDIAADGALEVVVGGVRRRFAAADVQHLLSPTLP